MKPSNPGGHPAYQHLVVSRILQLPNSKQTLNFTHDHKLLSIANYFYLFDLSYADELMKECYSDQGRKPRLPSDMLRSYMLSIKLKITSITDWVCEMRRTPLYAILSGFKPGDTPGIGTFYDFLNRCWPSPNPNLTDHIHLPKTVPKKPPKGEKAEPVEKITVADLVAQYEKEPYSTDQPFALLFSLYNKGFLSRSVSQGLVNLNDLCFCGDGTPVYSSARMRSRRLTDEEAKNSSAPEDERWFSQPDCDIGYDSSRECYYHGYDLYTLTAAEGNQKKTLPIFPLLHPASMHDSIGFVHCYFADKAFLHPSISEIYLDSAHDNMATYRLCEREGITPFIALNTRGAKTFEQQNITFGHDGVPICMAGLKMTRDGIERNRGRIKYRCPYAWSDIHKCEFCDQCCSTEYGKVVHTALKDNPRLFNIPPRESDGWKEKYKSRTAAERVNKRINVDYKFEEAHHRSTCYWYCRLYCILMCIHADAWERNDSALLDALDWSG